MAKTPSQRKLTKTIKELAQLFTPRAIQEELAKQYKLKAKHAMTEPEANFWYKCFRSSANLSSGMNKWAGELIEDLEEMEEDEE